MSHLLPDSLTHLLPSGCHFMKSPAKCFPSAYRSPYDFLLQFQLFTWHILRYQRQLSKAAVLVCFAISWDSFWKKTAPEIQKCWQWRAEATFTDLQVSSQQYTVALPFPHDGSKAQMTKLMYKDTHKYFITGIKCVQQSQSETEWGPEHLWIINIQGS